MPLKASIGLSRKVGQPDYGSLGANCQLEVELDASLAEDAEAFHDKVRRLYALGEPRTGHVVRAGSPDLCGDALFCGWTAGTPTRYHSYPVHMLASAELRPVACR